MVIGPEHISRPTGTIVGLPLQSDTLPDGHRLIESLGQKHEGSIENLDKQNIVENAWTFPPVFCSRGIVAVIRLLFALAYTSGCPREGGHRQT